MECVGFVLALIFFSLLLLNIPVAVAIGSATMLAVAVAGGSFRPEIIVPERMMFGINSFPLLAIPFFVLSGILMGRGGMARRLINFASALVGHLPGGADKRSQAGIARHEQGSADRVCVALLQAAGDKYFGGF